MDRLKDQVVAITGGHTEIAQGIAQRLAQEGAKVVLVSALGSGGGDTCESIDGIEPIEADIATADGAAKVANHVGSNHGKLDGLVVGASPEPIEWARLQDTDDAALDGAITSEVNAAWHMMRAAFPLMQETGGSMVVMLSAIGDFASRYIGPYTAAKGALHGLSRTAAHEWGRHRIRVNGLVTAADTRAFRDFKGKREEETKRRLKAYPLRRMGDPVRDIGGAVLFLLSDDTRYVTGQVVHADGGAFLTRPAFEPDMAS